MAKDPILLAVIQKQLDHIARQMGWVMTRTARSPIFSESHDFSCFITDQHGNAISVADGIPIHTGGGSFAVRALLRVFGDRLNEGDVFLLSDPYEAGGNHLPDWTMLRPVFVEGRLFAFACNRAHQSDIGGGAAGTYNAAATEIFHEGIRLPPLRIIEDGVVRDDLWRLLLLNSRCPDLLDGDLRAMIGSTAIGAGRIANLAGEVGFDRALQMLGGILDHAETTVRAAIAELPNGRYLGDDVSDNDCFDARDVAVRVELTIAGDEMTFDFAGTDRQIKGFKNSSLANTHSAVYMAVLAFLDSKIPRNEGTFRPLTVIAPEGTVVNATPPAPMTMCTVHPTSEIIHACWKALAQARPDDACAGWGKTSHCLSSGAHGDGRTFVLYHWHGSAAGGAVHGRDGFNSVGQLCTLAGMALPNVEIYERLYPVEILRQELRLDAAGPGQFRGGTGVHYEAAVEVPAEYSFRGEGVRSPTGYGVCGGGYGARGEMILKLHDGTTIDPPQYGVQSFGPLHLTVLSSGGGGYGDPLDRDPTQVLRDVENEVVSLDAARDLYGVVIDPVTSELDEGKTVEIRQQARSKGTNQSPGDRLRDASVA